MSSSFTGNNFNSFYLRNRFDNVRCIGTDNKKFEELLAYVTRPADSAMVTRTAYEAAAVAAKPAVGHGAKTATGA
jgi:hypothetical protein